MHKRFEIYKSGKIVLNLSSVPCGVSTPIMKHLMVVMCPKGSYGDIRGEIMSFSRSFRIPYYPF